MIDRLNQLLKNPSFHGACMLAAVIIPVILWQTPSSTSEPPQAARTSSETKRSDDRIDAKHRQPVPTSPKPTASDYVKSAQFCRPLSRPLTESKLRSVTDHICALSLCTGTQVNATEQLRFFVAWFKLATDKKSQICDLADRATLTSNKASELMFSVVETPIVLDQAGENRACLNVRRNLIDEITERFRQLQNRTSAESSCGHRAQTKMSSEVAELARNF